MDPPLDWLQWFAVSIPVCVVSVILIWLLLLASYRPARLPEGLSDAEEGGSGTLEIKPIRATREKFTKKQWFVTAVCVITIGLWCVEHEIELWVGDMGVIALIPVIAFFGTGVLKKVCLALHVSSYLTWSLMLCRVGRLRTVRVDDRFPCYGRYRTR
jgi:phosphate transporter